MFILRYRKTRDNLSSSDVKLSSRIRLFCYDTHITMDLKMSVIMRFQVYLLHLTSKT